MALQALGRRGSEEGAAAEGGDACAETMVAILGVEVAQSWPSRPVIHCGASLEDRLGRNEYQGEQICTAANMVAGVRMVREEITG